MWGLGFRVCLAEDARLVSEPQFLEFAPAHAPKPRTKKDACTQRQPWFVVLPTRHNAMPEIRQPNAARTMVTTVVSIVRGAVLPLRYNAIA